MKHQVTIELDEEDVRILQACFMTAIAGMKGCGGGCGTDHAKHSLMVVKVEDLQARFLFAAVTAAPVKSADKWKCLCTKNNEQPDFVRWCSRCGTERVAN